MFEELSDNEPVIKRQRPGGRRAGSPTSTPVIALGVIIIAILLVIAGLMIYHEIEKHRAEQVAARYRELEYETAAMRVKNLSPWPDDWRPEDKKRFDAIRDEANGILARYPHWRDPSKIGTPNP